MAYTHLTSEERHYIEKQHKMQDSTTTIALALGRSQSSISRELVRNCGQRGYRHKQAHGKARQRHVDKPKAVKLTSALVDSLERLLERQWSPEQISGRLKAEGRSTVCHETIYHACAKGQAGGWQAISESAPPFEEIPQALRQQYRQRQRHPQPGGH